MSKVKNNPDGSSDQSADAWASPEMSALDNLIKKVVKVPKKEIDKAIEDEKSQKRD